MNLQELEKAKHHAERMKAYEEQLRKIKTEVRDRKISGIYITSEKGGECVTTIRDPELLAASLYGIIEVLENRIQDEATVLIGMGVEVNHGS